MFVLGQQPSAASANIVQFVAHPLQASGVNALIQIICNEFSRVPRVLEDFGASLDHFPNVLAVAAWIAVLVEDMYRRPENYYTNQISRTSFDCLCFVFGCLLLSDAVVFAVLISSTLLPILLIFACLALASLVVHNLRPSIRPKHSAPCMALLAATYLHCNADAVDDWIVPFVSLIAVLWCALTLGIHYLPSLYSAVKFRFSPRIRVRNGELCTPRGGAVFASDAECPVCLETLHGCEVKVLPCRHVFHASCCARTAAGARSFACPSCRGRTRVVALRQFLFE